MEANRSSFILRFLPFLLLLVCSSCSQFPSDTIFLLCKETECTFLAMNYLNLIWSFIWPSFLRHMFAGHRILSWQILFFWQFRDVVPAFSLALFLARNLLSFSSLFSSFLPWFLLRFPLYLGFWTLWWWFTLV